MEKEPPKTQTPRTCHSEKQIETLIEKNKRPLRPPRIKPGAIFAPGGTPLDISSSLRPPILPNVNPDAIRYDEAHAGVTIHIPGSPSLRCDDVILFYWGLHKSESVLYQDPADSSVVRVLCITYNFLPHAQYGLVDLHYEVQRNGVIIGKSPMIRVNVHYCAPVTPKQRHRKRTVSRRYPSK
jgi:hypothetical protein